MAETAEMKYTVSDLAKSMGMESASVRVLLRKSAIEKVGKAYGWSTKAELDEVAKRLRSKGSETEAPKSIKPAKVKVAKDEAPAPAKKGKKTDRKAA